MARPWTFFQTSNDLICRKQYGTCFTVCSFQWRIYFKDDLTDGLSVVRPKIFIYYFIYNFLWWMQICLQKFEIGKKAIHTERHLSFEEVQIWNERILRNVKFSENTSIRNDKLFRFSDSMPTLKTSFGSVITKKWLFLLLQKIVTYLYLATALTLLRRLYIYDNTEYT